MTAVTTERLILRCLTTDDAALMVALLNDPDFLRFVGDRKVRTEEDARRYLTEGPIAAYARHGFGPYAVERKEGHVPIGICGLFKRNQLPDPDIGFAFLPAWRSQGFARESAQAVLAEARTRLGLRRVFAIVDPANEASIRLLKRLGLEATGTLPAAQGGAALACYAIEFGREGAVPEQPQTGPGAAG